MGKQKRVSGLGAIRAMRRKKILVKGPALSASGYGEQARFALECLKSREDIFDIFVEPINWGKTGWISMDTDMAQWINHMIMKTHFHNQNHGIYDISLQVTIPNEWQKIAPINVGYTAGVETNLVAPVWIEKSTLMDRIITTSKHAADSYTSTSYTARNNETGEVVGDYRTSTPIHPVNYCTRYTDATSLDIDVKTKFNFLTVAQWGPRKNVENTIRWFLDVFKENEDVGLVLKCNIMKNCVLDRHYMKVKLNNMLSAYPDRKCSVYLLHGDLTNGEMAALYNHPKIKGLLSLTHGEGFGLPLFEAACNGLPVLAPDWSGQVDFLYGNVKNKKGKISRKALYTKLDYTLETVPPQAVWEGVIQKESKWCNVVEKDCKDKLNSFYKNYNFAVGKAKKLKAHLSKEFAPDKKYAEFVEQILNCVPDAPSSNDVLVFD
jgi:glycosyltransferase involved in cell wall biosynthesis